MLQRGGRWLLRQLLPPACPLCKQTLAFGWVEPFCPDCWAGFTPLPQARCSSCALPFVAADNSSHLCGRCLIKPPPFTTVYAAGRFNGSLREAVHRFKFNQCYSLDRSLGLLLNRALPAEHDPELLVPVPLHPRRLRQRSYNQALLLARELGRLRSLPVMPLLEKVLETESQQGLRAEQRESNLKRAFQTVTELDGERVLLVDDVMTTGATAKACSKVLLDAGAAGVDVAVVGRA